MYADPTRKLQDTSTRERLDAAFEVVRTLSIAIPLGNLALVLYWLGNGELTWATLDPVYWIGLTLTTFVLGSILVVSTFAVAPRLEATRDWLLS